MGWRGTVCTGHSNSHNKKRNLTSYKKELLRLFWLVKKNVLILNKRASKLEVARPSCVTLLFVWIKTATSHSIEWKSCWNYSTVKTIQLLCRKICKDDVSWRMQGYNEFSEDFNWLICRVCGLIAYLERCWTFLERV